MCGLLLIHGYPVDPPNTGLLEHRGPDAVGVVRHRDTQLAHTRLSIIDLASRSDQPFTDGDLVLIFNGEIYNYKELIREHSLQVRTASDTEVLLKMYQKYSMDCLQYLNGMFAFVIYDKSTGQFVAARDRLGIKPLYIHTNGRRCILCSEIRPIQEIVNEPISKFSIRQYRQFRMCVNNDTVYRHIYMFPAGHWFSSDQSQMIPYWTVNLTDRSAPTDEEFEELLVSSIKYRQIADVEIGTYLSGGLDSSILTAVCHPGHTWTVGMADFNEFEYAAEVAEHVNTTHHEVLVDKHAFLEAWEWLVRQRHEPLSVPNEVLLYLMTKEVKTSNTVVLSGEGADELLFGYDRIFKWAATANTFDPVEFAEKYCYGPTDPQVVEFALSTVQGDTPLQKLNHYFLTNHIQGLLRRLDNSTMRCSVEGRVPFLDHRLVDRLAGAPFDWKLNTQVKAPLVRIGKKMLPERIVHRRKVGFPVPLISYDRWLDRNIELLQDV